MKRYFVLLVTFSLLLSVAAQAQGEPVLTDLEILVWPEYDRPEMLVILRGTYDQGTQLPVPVEVAIPASAGAPSAVAYVDEGGNRMNQTYTTRVEGDNLIVVFELAALGYQVEYYDALAIDEGGQRQYTLKYTAGHEVTALVAEFQVPPTAQSFTLEPVADSVRPESDGLTYHMVQSGPVAAGETVSWTASYQKDNDTLTATGVAAAANPDPDEPAPVAPTQGSGGNSTALIFFIAFVALTAVGAVAFWLGRRTQPVPEAAAPKKRKRRGSGRGDSGSRGSGDDLGLFTASGQAPSLYCHQCGTKLRSDSVFCHKCGAATRAMGT